MARRSGFLVRGALAALLIGCLCFTDKPVSAEKPNSHQIVLKQRRKESLTYYQSDGYPCWFYDSESVTLNRWRLPIVNLNAFCEDVIQGICGGVDSLWQVDFYYAGTNQHVEPVLVPVGCNLQNITFWNSKIPDELYLYWPADQEPPRIYVKLTLFSSPCQLELYSNVVQPR